MESHLKSFILILLTGLFYVSCNKKNEESSAYTGDIWHYERTVDAESITIKEATTNYKKYICTEIVLEAHYIKHLEGDWIAQEADGKGLTLAIVGRSNCDYYAHDGEYLYVPEMMSSSPALIRGTLHRGTLKGRGGLAHGLFFEDALYLQLHAVVYPKGADIQQ